MLSFARFVPWEQIVERREQIVSTHKVFFGTILERPVIVAIHFIRAVLWQDTHLLTRHFEVAIDVHNVLDGVD